jgi:hypothetical protein
MARWLGQGGRGLWTGMGGAASSHHSAECHLPHPAQRSQETAPDAEEIPTPPKPGCEIPPPTRCALHLLHSPKSQFPQLQNRGLMSSLWSALKRGQGWTQLCCPCARGSWLNHGPTIASNWCDLVMFWGSASSPTPGGLLALSRDDRSRPRDVQVAPVPQPAMWTHALLPLGSCLLCYFEQ